MNNLKYVNGGGKNKGIVLLKFLAALLITYSHMAILFPKFQGLVTGGAIGDGLFFFCSGFTLFLGRNDNFINWYKRRINRIYPTIIMWALLSTFVFGWNWSVSDLIFTPKYWFIPCIMVYYIIFYFIKTYWMKYLNIVIIITAIIIAMSDYFILNHSKSIMYADIKYMRIYYFSFMLLGAITALKNQGNNSLKKSLIYTIVYLALYYVCMAIYKIDDFYCNFQFISLFPLLAVIYWIYQLCNTEKVSSLLSKKYIGWSIFFISGLTLEIYMVQYALFTNRFNDIFPVNIILTYIVIFVTAYLLKCLSRVFTMIFSDKRFIFKDIFKIEK